MKEDGAAALGLLATAALTEGGGIDPEEVGGGIPGPDRALGVVGTKVDVAGVAGVNVVIPAGVTGIKVARAGAPRAGVI